MKNFEKIKASEIVMDSNHLSFIRHEPVPWNPEKDYRNRFMMFDRADIKMFFVVEMGIKEKFMLQISFKDHTLGAETLMSGDLTEVEEAMRKLNIDEKHINAIYAL